MLRRPLRPSRHAGLRRLAWGAAFSTLALGLASGFRRPGPATSSATIRPVSRDFLLETAERLLADQRDIAATRTNVHAVLLGFGGAVAALGVPTAGAGLALAILVTSLAILATVFVTSLILDRQVVPDRLRIVRERLDASEEEVRERLLVATLASVDVNRGQERRQAVLQALAILAFTLLVGDALFILA